MASLRKDVVQTLAVIYRGVQVLLVAHGAALLSLITTYVKEDGLVPEFVRPVLVKLGIGFLMVVLAAVANTIVEMEAIPPAKHSRASAVVVVGVTVCTGASVLLLIWALSDVLELTRMPKPP